MTSNEWILANSVSTIVLVCLIYALYKLIAALDL